MGSNTRLSSAFRQARYSYFNLAVYTVVMAGTLVLIISSWQRHSLANVLHSRLPNVRMAEETVVPDDVAYRKQYDFTTNWFTWNIPVWEQALKPFQGQPDLHYLEIGLHEGRSAVWMLENVLSHPTAKLTGVDIFTAAVKDRYLANIELSGSADKVTTITGYSQEVMRELPLDTYDIVYIDGSHAENDVLEDAVLSWRLLKEGGILIFDDYDWYLTNEEGQITELPKEAIDSFIRCFQKDVDVIHKGYQIILRKKRQTEPAA